MVESSIAINNETMFVVTGPSGMANHVNATGYIYANLPAGDLGSGKGEWRSERSRSVAFQFTICWYLSDFFLPCQRSYGSSNHLKPFRRFFHSTKNDQYVWWWIFTSKVSPSETKHIWVPARMNQRSKPKMTHSSRIESHGCFPGRPVEVWWHVESSFHRFSQNFPLANCRRK